MPNMPISTPYLYPVNVSEAVQKLFADLLTLSKTLVVFLVIAIPAVLLILAVILLFKINSKIDKIYRSLSKSGDDENFGEKIKKLEGIFTDQEKDNNAEK